MKTLSPFASRTLFILLFSSLSLMGCSSVDSDPTYKDKRHEDMYEYGSLLSDEGGFDLFGGDDEKKTNNTGLGVNGYLWRAALDTLAFLPIASADPFGGVITTDWHSTEINKNERRKDAFLRTERTRLLRAANIAAANGDASGYREALKKIRDYNRELPRSARSKNLIMPDTIKKSRRAFDTRTKKMVGGIEYTPFMLRSLDEYDQGIQFLD